jgi:serine/threonine protein kinase
MSHRIFGLESLRTVCGSPGYMAPEIVKQVSDFECLFY